MVIWRGGTPSSRYTEDHATASLCVTTQAGPRERQTVYPIGGQGLFVNNFEVRTPPVLLPYVGENMSLVFFHDMGNVFAKSSEILSGLVRFQQRKIAPCARPNV